MVKFPSHDRPLDRENDARCQDQGDEWSDWLLHARHADDPPYEKLVRTAVRRYADRVLDDACLSAGATLLDIGAGDGLLAFRAIERIGVSLRVVLTDISAPMLRHAEALSVQRGVRDQCTFLRCSAEALSGIADASVDAAAARAAVAYVPDKRAAFAEIFRVLVPGGRLAIAEPILQDEAFLARALKERVGDPNARRTDPSMTLLHRWKAAQFPDTEAECAKSPLVNFSERDLVNFARQCGFDAIHVELHIDVAPSLITTWEVFLDSSPHPWAPTLRKILADQFSPDERRFFEQMLRPTVESGKHVSTERIAYMRATKPRE